MDKETHYDKEISYLQIDKESAYKPTIKIWSNGSGKSTRQMDITLEQLEQIRIILNEGIKL